MMQPWEGGNEGPPLEETQVRIIEVIRMGLNVSIEQLNELQLACAAGGQMKAQQNLEQIRQTIDDARDDLGAVISDSS